MCRAVLQSKARGSRRVYRAPDDLLSLPFLLPICSDSHAHTSAWLDRPSGGSECASSCVCVATEALAALPVACAVFSLLL